MESFRNPDKQHNVEKIETRSFNVVDKELLKERLITINDDERLQSEVYSRLLLAAGEQLPAIAIAGIISLAIENITHGDRRGPSSQLVRMFVPHFVDAMVDDAEGRAQVKELLGRPLA